MRKLLVPMLFSIVVLVPAASAAVGPLPVGSTDSEKSRPRPAAARSPPARTSAARRTPSTVPPSGEPSARPQPAFVVPAHLQAIAACESGGDPRAIGGGGAYRGKYQFSYSTWAAVGGSGDPAAAPETEQDRRAAMLYARSGPGSGQSADDSRGRAPGPRYDLAATRLRGYGDGAAGHDVVPAVVPADPGLVAAVVVGRPQHQGRLVLPHLAAVLGLLVETAPHPHERVLLPLVADRRGVGVAWTHDASRAAAPSARP